jgi:hypothetical protein
MLAKKTYKLKFILMQKSDLNKPVLDHIVKLFADRGCIGTVVSHSTNNV